MIAPNNYKFNNELSAVINEEGSVSNKEFIFKGTPWFHTFKKKYYTTDTKNNKQ